MIPKFPSALAPRSLFRRVPQRLKAAFLETGFARHVALLSSGAAAAHAINLLSAPVIARLYSPAAIGIFALFASFLDVAVVSLSLSYELAIISAADDRRAARLVLACLLFCLPLSVLLSLLLYVLIRHHLLGFGALFPVAPLLMAFTLLFMGMTTALRYWEIRQERFRMVCRMLLWQQGGRSLTQTATGLFWGSPLGLLWGELLGRLAALAAVLPDVVRPLRASLEHSKAGEFRRALSEHRNFPFYSLPSTILDTVAVNLPVPLIVLLYGPRPGGYLALVQRVMAVPAALLAANIADVLHSRLALYARERPQDCIPLFRRTALMLAALGCLPAVVMFLFGPPLFSLVFGRQWATAGAIAAVMAPWFLVQFVVSPLSRVVLVFNGQAFKFIYDVVTVAGVALVFWMARQFGFPLMRTLWCLTGINTLAYLAYFGVLLYVLRRARRELPVDAVRSGPSSAYAVLEVADQKAE